MSRYFPKGSQFVPFYLEKVSFFPLAFHFLQYSVSIYLQLFSIHLGRIHPFDTDRRFSFRFLRIPLRMKEFLTFYFISTVAYRTFVEYTEKETFPERKREVRMRTVESQVRI